ncbi:DUF3870 domain-containing protein [Alkalihalophilus marmarensis]|uniref:DUF3870 domain-containing protein n=1 Tax=Alkalihalophilus marmarensis TaxID=521377 RepID=UPI002DBE688E|nr:DUF3870 domain-containing protein [Alkalihalophilus marmarensis]MEC2073387.1 DUF3870 domain-containing protein [Alkalihalophilus marmarensis]
MFDQDSIYIVGEAKSPSNNPITEQYKVFFIGFVVDRLSGKIIDAEATSILSITSSFIRHLFVGKNIRETDQIVNAIEEKYYGSSQKAVIVAFRHASQKFNQLHNV